MIRVKINQNNITISNPITPSKLKISFKTEEERDNIELTIIDIFEYNNQNIVFIDETGNCKRIIRHGK